MLGDIPTKNFYTNMMMYGSIFLESVIIDFFFSCDAAHQKEDFAVGGFLRYMVDENIQKIIDKTIRTFDLFQL